MILGFVGTGNIASAVVRGFCAADRPPAQLLVSPRSADKAARLAAEFERVEVAADNQAVVDGADCVVLSVLPTQAREVVGALRFRAGHQVISLLALTPVATVSRLVAPAGAVVRAVPLPSAARRLGPIGLYPGAGFAVDLLGRIGTPVPAASELELETLWSLTALIAPYYALLETVCDYAVAAGVARPTAKAYVASMFHGLSVLGQAHAGDGFAGLVAEAQTPGGLNEQALRQIRAAGGYGAIADALDNVLVRLGGTPPPRPPAAASKPD
jgi:pyrroline-5-carboxylate reductase